MIPNFQKWFCRTWFHIQLRVKNFDNLAESSIPFSIYSKFKYFINHINLINILIPPVGGASNTLPLLLYFTQRMKWIVKMRSITLESERWFQIALVSLMSIFSFNHIFFHRPSFCLFLGLHMKPMEFPSQGSNQRCSCQPRS